MRGFGVRIPGGAPTIKVLTWWFTPGWGLFRFRGGGRSVASIDAAKFDNRPTWANKGEFDSRPGWDNWNKKR
ncbi:multiple cyclophane-containing RiPP AmcA [Micromonospora chersina]